MSNQAITPQVQHAYLHPVFAPADLEAAASAAGATQVAGGGFRQTAASTPFLSIAGLTTGQFRLRVLLCAMEGGADGRSPVCIKITPALGATVLSATAALGSIQSIDGIGVATINLVPDNTDAARGAIDITVTCSAPVAVDIQIYHRRFLATASAYQTAA